MPNPKLTTLTIDQTARDIDGNGLEHLFDGTANGSLRGNLTTAESSGYSLGQGAVALGSGTTATGDYSFADGISSRARGEASHAEGDGTTASGNKSHSEGFSTTASGVASHAEGSNTTASGNASHAEGTGTTASGVNSHAQNESTTAQGVSQTAIGQFNVAQGTTNSKVATDHAFIIGNGTSSTNRSNAMYVQWNGKQWLADTLEVSRDPSANMEVATKQYVDWTKSIDALVRAGTVAQNTDTSFTLSESAENFMYIGVNLYTQNNANRFLLQSGQFRNSINGSYGKQQYFSVWYNNTQYLMIITTTSATQLTVRHNIPNNMNFSVAGYHRIANYPTASGTNSTSGLLMARGDFTAEEIMDFTAEEITE